MYIFQGHLSHAVFSNGMFRIFKIPSDKLIVQPLCNSRATCNEASDARMADTLAATFTHRVHLDSDETATQLLIS